MNRPFFPDNGTAHDEQENTPSNNSGNKPFGEVLQGHLSRRNMMRGTLAAAVSAIIAPRDLLAQPLGKGKGRGKGPFKDAPHAGNLSNFSPVTIADYASKSNGGRIPVISADYDYQVLIPWGTPIKAGVPEYAGDPLDRPSAQEQENQIGIGHDGMWLFPTGGNTDQNSDGILCINHEFGGNTHVLGRAFPENAEDVALSQAAHGCSVVRVARKAGRWDVVFDARNRRITVNTPVAFDGPVAGSAFLENTAANRPLGTVNNCGSGVTPWGTYLTCEENFNAYFGWTDGNFQRNEKQERYGFSENGFGYGWHLFDPRFDLSNAAYANEYNRFGWVVEIDPQNPGKPPVKHTALGCFKHEAIAIRVPRSGKAVCYMGDDQRFDYCYRFISRKPWQKAVAQGESPLADGTLYVARFNEDGTGDWLELSMDVPALAARFSSLSELLVNTRIAADIVGATPMDRPEWTTIAADGDSVFWCLTNNSQRTEANVANPEAPNDDGHIIKTRDRGQGNGTKFDWEFFILASSTTGTDEVFSDPDAAYADADGRLFIGTDGGQKDGLNDQLTVFDTTAADPQPRRLFVGVNSDEITGWTQTPDQKTGMTNIQHPGNGDPSRTNFPAPDNSGLIPRDCTIVLTRKDGGKVGS